MTAGPEHYRASSSASAAIGVDDRPHPREVDGHDGLVRPVGGGAQADRRRVATGVQVREPACAPSQPTHLIG
jgi:hypothetical protein